MKRFSPAYWNLIREIAVSSIKLRYKTSVLGFFWSLAKPMALLGVLYVLSTRVLHFDLPNAPLYILLGIINWNFFAEGTTHAMTCPLRREGLLQKVYFPREILLLGDSLMIAQIYALNLLVFFGFYFVFGLAPTASWIGFVVAWPLLFMFVLGIGALGAAWIARFRDLQHIWEITVQLWFWGTPVFYNADRIPSYIRPLYELSPVARLLATIRASFLPAPVLRAGGALTLSYNLVTAALVLPVFAAGLWSFIRRAPRIAEEL